MKESISLAASPFVVAAIIACTLLVSACSGSGSGGSDSKESSSDKTSGNSGNKESSGTSTSDSNAGSGSGAGTGSDSSKGGDTAKVCVKPGDKGNEKGIGAYCETTAQCKSGLLCTKDFGAGPTEPWFCTATCDDDASCGADAMCFAETRGKGCLPNACKP